MWVSYLKLRLAFLGPLVLFFIAYFINNSLGSLAAYPIYLAPILWISSKWGWPIGFLFAILAALLPTSSGPFFAASNGQAYLTTFIVKLTTLVSLSLLYSSYRGIINSQKQRLDRLIAIIPQCPDCGAVFCGDNQWRSLEQIKSDPKAYAVSRKHDCYGDGLGSK